MALLEQPEKVRLALSPLRRQLLERLREPASAAQLAAELDIPRQKLGYHLRLLEQAGLLEVAEERQRRGFQERVMQAVAGAFVVDPQVVSASSMSGDRLAAEHLIETSAQTVRHVARMQSKAEEQGKRLLTFTIEATVHLESPADLHRFSDELASAVAEVAASFDVPGGRPYRLVIGGHPAPAQTGADS
ncbi:MAG TPA: helix-turn-helix domain-containing protein [Candidatus Limnocylindrales bacterium]|nr:helix-turn-helix domain-containing protein [Candidatus Limnocylindrales bacterium]